jgi:HK97 family phage portal protein
VGIIKNILFKNYSMTDFDRDVRAWIGGRPTHSGVKVNEHTALRHITVYSCVRVRSESFGMLPLSVYRKRRNGKGRDEAYDHPLYEKVHAVPNADMTSMTWRETMNGHLDLSGNGYSIITQNNRGQVIDLYPWPWTEIEPRRNNDTGKIEYHLNDRGKTEILPAERVFHVPGLGFDGIKGYSIIRMAQEAVGLGLAISEFSARFFGQGMNVGSVFQTDQEMTQPAIDDLRAQLMEKGAGLANSWMPFILHSGLKFARIPMPLSDAQFIENTKLNKAEICGLFRVPPHLVADLDRATFSNIEHQSIEYVVFSMLPLITRFEQTMNWKLFTRQERDQGYYVKFNIDALLRGDSKARAEYLTKKRQNGVINADEWRELDDENPIGGIAGTAYLVNGNMISTETAARQQPKQAGDGGIQPQPPEPPERNEGGD